MGFQGAGSPQGCLANFFPEQGEWDEEREIEKERQKREIGQPGRDVEVG